MRTVLIVMVALALLSPQSATAGLSALSTVVLSHPVVSPGQQERVTVTARDLAGHPLGRASVTARVTSGKVIHTYVLPPTNSHGQTNLSFLVEHTASSGVATVAVSILKGYLHIPLQAHFTVRGSPSRAAPVRDTLAIVARVLPSAVTAPQPGWVVIDVHTQGGIGANGADVTVIAAFKEGVEKVHAVTDSAGIATVRLDTLSITQSQTVHIAANVTWRGARGSTAVVMTVVRPATGGTPLPVPTVKPAPLPTPTAVSTSTDASASLPQAPATALPTWTPQPTWTSQPTWTPAPTAPATVSVAPSETTVPTWTPTPAPTFAPLPTWTPMPTSTPVPTWTPIPTSTPVPTATPMPQPVASPTPVPNCPGSDQGCMQAMLNMINETRAQYGVNPLSLSAVQSAGTGSCVGSIGHSRAMQQSGTIWHQNDAYPAASWPNNICVYWSNTGENVGANPITDELQALRALHAQMMSEPHDPGTCASMLNHACNIISTKYNRIGIGILVVGGTTWLTEDFIG